MRWVKAHARIKDNTTHDEALDVIGNGFADAAAKMGVLMHPQPSSGDECVQQWYEKHAEVVAKAVGRALVLFPRRQEKLERTDVRERRPQGQDEEEALHDWNFSCGRWRCFRCGTWTRAQEVSEARKKQRCKGMAAEGYMSRISARGHQIRRATGDLPFVYCKKCGAWANRRMRGLMRACNGPSTAGREALNRIGEGRHPWRDEVKRGGTGHRAQIRTASIYCSATLRWIPVHGMTSQEEEAEEGGETWDGDQAAGQQDPLSVTPGGPTAQEALEETPHEWGWTAEHEFDESQEDVFGHGGSLSEAAKGVEYGRRSRPTKTEQRRMQELKERTTSKQRGGGGTKRITKAKWGRTGTRRRHPHTRTQNAGELAAPLEHGKFGGSLPISTFSTISRRGSRRTRAAPQERLPLSRNVGGKRRGQRKGKRRKRRRAREGREAEIAARRLAAAEDKV